MRRGTDTPRSCIRRRGPGPRYKQRMRFSTGLLVGGAVGYYFGAKAGRDRYHELERWLDKVRATGAYEQARAKLDEVVDTVRADGAAGYSPSR